MKSLTVLMCVMSLACEVSAQVYFFPGAGTVRSGDFVVIRNLTASTVSFTATVNTTPEPTPVDSGLIAARANRVFYVPNDPALLGFTLTAVASTGDSGNWTIAP